MTNTKLATATVVEFVKFIPFIEYKHLNKSTISLKCRDFSKDSGFRVYRQN